MRDDERYMQRAVELAAAPPFTLPNPRVGAVVVRDGIVLGEGAHEGPGTAHAEAAALEGIDARGATVYVTLEPCNHHGRTPPCAPALVAAGVRRVVATTEDPDPRVAGSGFDLLRRAGVDVEVGVLRERAERLNRAYFHQRRTGRSFVSLKLALTLDGNMTAPDGSSQWITGSEGRRVVHARRLECDAVMVGAGTVVADDPRLTVREVPAPRQPLRVIVDAAGRVRPDAAALGDGSLVATTQRAPHERQIAWKESGAEVLVLPEDDRGVDLAALLDALGDRRVVEVFCEGGPRLASSLIRGGLVGQLELHYGAVLTGGGLSLDDLGVTSIDDGHRFRLDDLKVLGNDVVVTMVRIG
ncbi:MAG TPA: bifunctional diaminohydroxyphosphoribosylaminopyrimidine deaminase/5-amino-6-(5-phosphoribosylamino)uracil reductase RibD [Actinomycetota bacterium]|nr:bifunctional diaminohydroxyphosphoribosylaminopyrimidine deaminase/5-amino-6-(5-phosphoribosylamino)uracil reductase RibD [Actinomycetota bacterium]